MGAKKHFLGRGLAVLLVAGLALAGWSTQARAQRVIAEVTTILKTLPLEKQQKLADFHEKIERYIDDYDWFDEPEIDIHIKMQWMLEDISSSSEERYRAQILVSNASDIQYFDKRCRFPYNPNEPIVHNEPAFTALTGLIDYYVYLIIGGELDKYGTLMGTPYYEKARDIAEQAKFGLGRFVEGWDLRLDLARKLLSDEHKPFREMVDYYFYGLSVKDEDINEARKYVAEAVRRLANLLDEDPKNDFYNKFLDAHRNEIIDLFKDAKDKKVLVTLAQVDPDHKKDYLRFVQ